MILETPVDTGHFNRALLAAQDYAGAKWALGQRLVNHTDAAIDGVQ